MRLALCHPGKLLGGPGHLEVWPLLLLSKALVKLAMCSASGLFLSTLKRCFICPCPEKATVPHE